MAGGSFIPGVTPPAASGGPVPVSGTVTANQGAPNTMANAWPIDGSGVTQPISAASLPLPAGASTEATVHSRFGVSTGSPSTVSSAGDTTVYTPTTGKSVRLKWIGLSSPSTNTAPTTVKVSIGATEIYRWSMGAPGAFAHGVVREGAVNDVVKVNLSAAQTVFVNLDLEEF